MKAGIELERLTAGGPDGEHVRTVPRGPEPLLEASA